MSRIDDLAPDQRAVLQLLLGQGKSYVELSEMLRLDPEAVRQRAVSALDELGPRGGELPPPDERAEIADYLLGQQAASQRRATRELLETNAPARAWARVVAGELRPLAGDGLPEVPAEAAEVDQAFDALEARQTRRAEVDRSSRVGGAVLIIGAVIVAVAIILIVKSGGDDNKDSASTSTPSTQASTSTTTTGNGQPQVVNQVNMTPGAAAPKGVGVMYILRQSGQFALAVQAQDLPPTTEQRFYAAWMVGKGVSPRPLGFTPVVPSKGKSAGRLEFANALPDGASRYKRVVITAESQRNPKQPGAVALRGDLKLTRG
jgi:hypothetical protein